MVEPLAPLLEISDLGPQANDSEAKAKANVTRRKYAPKSKGGCTTCQSRHVRCDQTKPRCSSCRKSSRQCGYHTSNSMSTSGKTSNDKPEVAIKVVFYERGDSTHLKLNQRRLSYQPSLTSQERRALRYFRDVVAERISGYFDASFWTDAAMGVAMSTAPVRHAMVAVSSHWENVVVPGMHQRSTCDWECDDYALKQYTLAITEMRRNMKTAHGTGPASEQKLSKVELLLCNLLFICLEMFQNHYESALRQLSCGLYLFCEWDADRQDGFEDNEGQQSPNANEGLEKQLSHIFKRLMSQSLLFPLRRLDQRVLIPELSPKMPNVPDKFDTPDQARDSFNNCMSSILYGVKSRNLPSPPHCNESANFLTKWSTAFASFRAREENKLTKLERRNCTFLEMQRLAVYLWALSSSSFTSEMAFDDWMPEFLRLVELGQYLVDTKYMTAARGKILHYPKFDTGMILPTYLVASRCRDPKIRRHAVELLRLGPRQEGVWNGHILMSVAERIIEIEERGIGVVWTCADVPLSARVRLEDAAILTAQRKVAAVFVRGNAGVGDNGGGGGEVLYEMIPYNA